MVKPREIASIGRLASFGSIRPGHSAYEKCWSEMLGAYLELAVTRMRGRRELRHATQTPPELRERLLRHLQELVRERDPDCAPAGHAAVREYVARQLGEHGAVTGD